MSAPQLEPTSFNDGSQGTQKSANQDYIVSKLRKQGFDVGGENGLKVTSHLDQEGEEVFSVSGQMPASLYNKFLAALKEINDVKGIELEHAFLTTTDDEIETAQQLIDKDRQGLGLEGLPDPVVTVTAQFSEVKALQGPKGLGNPWLKPNGLVALQMALIELSIIQSQIKKSSSDFWKENLVALVSIAKDLGNLIVSSAKIQAEIHKNDAKAARQQAIVHFVNAGMQAAMLFGSLFAMYKSTMKNRVDKLREKMPKESANELNYQTEKTTYHSTAKQKNLELNAAEQKAKTATNRQEANANVERIKKDIADSDSKWKMKQDAYHNDKDQEAYLAQKKDLGEASFRDFQKINMINQSGGQILSSLAQGTNGMIESAKEFKKGELTLEKGVIDGLQEMVRALQTLHQKAMQQSEEERKQANELMTAALQSYKDAAEKTFRISIGRS